MIISRAQVVVRYAETDMMGVVYHANYLPWFEVGRTTLLKEMGLSYRQLETDGYRLPVLEVSAKFSRPAVYDDTLTIVTTLREKLVKIGAKVVRSARYVTFQLAEVAVSRELFAAILLRIGRLRSPPVVTG